MSVYTVIVLGPFFYMCLPQWDCSLNYLKDTIIRSTVNNNFLPSTLPDAHHLLPTPDNTVSHLFAFSFLNLNLLFFFFFSFDIYLQSCCFHFIFCAILRPVLLDLVPNHRHFIPQIILNANIWEGESMGGWRDFWSLYMDVTHVSNNYWEAQDATEKLLPC